MKEKYLLICHKILNKVFFELFIFFRFVLTKFFSAGTVFRFVFVFQEHQQPSLPQ